MTHRYDSSHNVPYQQAPIYQHCHYDCFNHLAAPEDALHCVGVVLRLLGVAAVQVRHLLSALVDDALRPALQIFRKVDLKRMPFVRK